MLGKNIAYRRGSTGSVDILRLDMDRQRADFMDIGDRPLDKLPAYESLASRLQNLDEEWDYSVQKVPAGVLEDSPELSGNLYYRDEDEWKLRTSLFEDFSLEVFGHDILESGQRVDAAALAL